MKTAELEKLSKWLHAQFHDKTNDVIFRGLCQLAHAQCQNILKGHGNERQPRNSDKGTTMGNVVTFPQAKVGRDVLSVVRDYFEKGPRQQIDPQLVPGDCFLAWLWLQGFKVVPLTEDDLR